ncbi:hypothetical protein LTR56_022226 [Elasticomyces elasticus]|nr:hypothetical protein LTR56_022226 [Elasticomyces elasticus]KAK3632416.1 hypothetical protein LTR22_020601 [Elasticomyces elasticus]KAK4917243.1 hypothetical protein LTR49_014864 [Elasticomyces elasticus]KAK5749619.1 hypothetical protein LTS12_020329 [Elasticomyces elasticus]
MPAELRIMFFRHVLCARYTLRESNGHEQLFNVALLRASKQIRAEAYEVFYRSNTFRIGCTDDLEFGMSLPANAIPFITQLELLEEPESVLLSLTQTTQALLSICPRLKRVTLGYDQYAKGKITISDTLRWAGLVDMSKWIDIGVLELELQNSPIAVSVKHFGLYKAWKRFERQGRRPEPHVSSVFASGGTQRDQSRIVRTAIDQQGLSIKMFLSLYDGWQSFRHYPNFSIGVPKHLKEAGRLARTFNRRMVSTTQVPKQLYEMNGLRMGDVDATRHSQALLQWVSELLVLNRVAFDVEDGYGLAIAAHQVQENERQTRREQRRARRTTGGSRRGTGVSHRRQRATAALPSTTAAVTSHSALQSFAYTGVGQRLGW